MQQLRTHAVSQTLFAPASLQAAIHRVGFVQADPIRAPAPAQDLILRHRVHGYRAGDLERSYASLDVEEGFLYAYGFLRRDLWKLRQHACDPATLPELAQRVLAAVRASGPTHPRDLEVEFGRKQVTNAWGGSSRATTRALEALCWRGLLRVARRENGIRVYEAIPPPGERLPPDARFRALVLAEAHVFAPVREKDLQFLASGLRRVSFPEVANHRSVIRDLLHTGELEQRTVDGISYLWPASTGAREEPPRCVRFLAPFDPLVWDRGRFEHLWQWSYRFEAYTPPSKRVRGYYAMPLLWGDRVIGWANAGVVGGKLDVEIGFVGERPADREFATELDAEIARLEAFLGLSPAAASLPSPLQRGSHE